MSKDDCKDPSREFIGRFLEDEEICRMTRTGARGGDRAGDVSRRTPRGKDDDAVLLMSHLASASGPENTGCVLSSSSQRAPGGGLPEAHQYRGAALSTIIARPLPV
eukprot:7660679-Pyramimonas_sp.AAC.2